MNHETVPVTLNQCVCSVMSNLKYSPSTASSLLLFDAAVVGVPGQLAKPRFQETSIAQYFYFRNTLFIILVPLVMNCFLKVNYKGFTS